MHHGFTRRSVSRESTSLMELGLPLEGEVFIETSHFKGRMLMFRSVSDGATNASSVESRTGAACSTSITSMENTPTIGSRTFESCVRTAALRRRPSATVGAERAIHFAFASVVELVDTLSLGGSA